jgi:hypothetical protein
MPSLPTSTGSRSRPGAVQRLAAELHRLALDREAAHAQHVVQRQAVLQAVHAAGVLGHVAADGAGDLAAGVGRVVQAERRRRFADGQVAHAALHGGRARWRSTLDDLVELGQAQRHAQRVRQAPPDRPVPAPRATTGTASGGRPQHGGHLGFGLGQRHGQRLLAVGGQAVAFVGHRVLAVPQQRVGRQHGRASAATTSAGGRLGAADLAGSQLADLSGNGHTGTLGVGFAGATAPEILSAVPEPGTWALLLAGAGLLGLRRLRTVGCGAASLVAAALA